MENTNLFIHYLYSLSLLHGAGAIPSWHWARGWGKRRLCMRDSGGEGGRSCVDQCSLSQLPEVACMHHFIQYTTYLSIQICLYSDTGHNLSGKMFWLDGKMCTLAQEMGVHVMHALDAVGLMPPQHLSHFQTWTPENVHSLPFTYEQLSRRYFTLLGLLPQDFFRLRGGATRRN